MHRASWLETALLAGTLATTACTALDDASGPPSPTFEELRASLPPGPRPGTYLVEGDIALTLDELRAYHGYYAEGRPTDLWLVQGGPGPAWSIVMTEGIDDAVYPVTRKLDLTYCVSDVFHGGHARLVRLLDQATSDWERHAHVNFVHRPEYDDECDKVHSNTFFTVERVGLTHTIYASAFFPNDPFEERILHITDFGMDQSDAALLGTLRHELGHILGLRHEHIANPVTCTTESPADSRPLTPFDATSVMHYDWCPGAYGPNDEISRYDALGIRYLYNLPTHGRRGEVLGAMYTQYTDYDGDGLTDVFWHRSEPGVSKLLHKGTPDLAFESVSYLTTPDSLPMRPFAERFTPTFGVSTDLFFHGPVAYADHLLSSMDDMPWFDPLDTNIFGKPVPLAGDYTGDGYADLIWYAPGPAGDSMWIFDDVWFDARTLSIDGYYLPVVGDFSCDGRDDVFWYDPVGATSVVWRSAGNGLFAVSFLDNAAAGLPLTGTPFIPIPGHFDADPCQDILWYRPGTASDRLWLGGPLGPATSSVARTVNGSYRPIAADFNGDGRKDVFWYAPGAAKDSVWFFQADASHTELFLAVSGDYAPFAGDFDGDVDTDLLWYRGFEAKSSIWRAQGGTFAATGPASVPERSYPVGYGPTP
jgi:hypothetical protein